MLVGKIFEDGNGWLAVSGFLSETHPWFVVYKIYAILFGITIPQFAILILSFGILRGTKQSTKVSGNYVINGNRKTGGTRSS